MCAQRGSCSPRRSGTLSESAGGGGVRGNRAGNSPAAAGADMWAGLVASLLMPRTSSSRRTRGTSCLPWRWLSLPGGKAGENSFAHSVFILSTNIYQSTCARRTVLGAEGDTSYQISGLRTLTMRGGVDTKREERQTTQGSVLFILSSNI